MAIYAGKWQKEEMGAELADEDWLVQESGVAIIVLTSTPSATPGMHDVEVRRALQKPL